MTTCQDVITAARDLREWHAFIAPWAAADIKKALHHVVTNPNLPRSAEVPVPTFAKAKVAAAVRHATLTARHHERVIEQHTPTRKVRF